MTLDDMITLYVKTVLAPYNGLGQCIVNSPGHHSHEKQSHWLLHDIYDAAKGTNSVDRLIEEEFQRVKIST